MRGANITLYKRNKMSGEVWIILNLDDHGLSQFDSDQLYPPARHETHSDLVDCGSLLQFLVLAISRVYDHVGRQKPDVPTAFTSIPPEIEYITPCYHSVDRYHRR
jgi:hypothetical protein